MLASGAGLPLTGTHLHPKYNQTQGSRRSELRKGGIHLKWAEQKVVTAITLHVCGESALSLNILDIFIKKRYYVN